MVPHVWVNAERAAATATSTSEESAFAISVLGGWGDRRERHAVPIDELAVDEQPVAGPEMQDSRRFRGRCVVEEAAGGGQRHVGGGLLRFGHGQSIVT
jgi:hypothetical protein